MDCSKTASEKNSQQFLLVCVLFVTLFLLSVASFIADRGTSLLPYLFPQVSRSEE